MRREHRITTSQRWLLDAVRYGLPITLVIAGLGVLLVDSDSRRFEGFAMLVGSGLSVALTSVLFRKAFDEIREGLSKDRSQFYKDLSAPFYGANPEGSTVSQGVRDAFSLWSMQVGLKGVYDCVKAFSETDLTEDLKKIDVPTLIVHGDDDQIVPIGASAEKSAKLVTDSTLKIYPRAPHGLFATRKDEFNADLMDFIRA